MRLLKRIGRGFVDFLELYLPISVFILMFIAFLVNIVFRYVLKNPQNWTFEFSTNSFVIIGLLGACIAYRKEDHVIFDLVYNRLAPRGQGLMRIVSHVIVIIVFLIAIPESLLYLARLPSVTSIMRIPERFLFMVFPIMLISITCRSVYRLVLDIKAFRNRTYNQTYNTTAKDALI